MDWAVGDGSHMNRLSRRKVRGRGGLGVTSERDGGRSRGTGTRRVGPLERRTTFILEEIAFIFQCCTVIHESLSLSHSCILPLSFPSHTHSHTGVLEAYKIL